MAHLPVTFGRLAAFFVVPNARVLQPSGETRAGALSNQSDYMVKRTNQLIIGLAVTAVATVIAWSLIAAGNPVPPGMVAISQHINPAHSLILGAVAIAGTLVFAAMFISIYLHRRSRTSGTATFSHSPLAEVVWTAIPVLIVVGTAIPATQMPVETDEPAWRHVANSGTLDEAWTHVAAPAIHRRHCAGLCAGDGEFLPLAIKLVDPEVYAAWHTDRRTPRADAAEDAEGPVLPARLRLYKGNGLER